MKVPSAQREGVDAAIDSDVILQGEAFWDNVTVTDYQAVDKFRISALRSSPFLRYALDRHCGVQ